MPFRLAASLRRADPYGSERARRHDSAHRLLVRALVLVATAIAAASPAASAAPAGHGSRAPGPHRTRPGAINPGPLWSTFPLGQRRISQEHALENAPRAPHVTRAAQSGRGASHHAVRDAILGIAVAGAVLILLVAVRLRRRRSRTSPARAERRYAADATNDSMPSQNHRPRIAETVGQDGARSPDGERHAEDRPPVDGRREGHLLFVPTADGYALLERPGAAPSVERELDGDELGLEGRFRVSRIVTSPLPSDERECAYLERA